MSSNSTIRSVPVTTQDILDAYNAHQDDFMIIDIENLRPTQYAQYCKINIKRADGSIVNPSYWKLSGQGITTATPIKEPSKRCYAQLRIGLCQVTNINGEDVETDNMKAMKLLCTTYENKMEQMKDNKIITDSKKNVRKQADGTNTVFLISTKAISPMDTMVTDRDSGEMVEREHPFYWISVPNKRWWAADEVQKESVHFNDQYYFDASLNGPDTSRPIMTFEYQPVFYNIENWYHHPRNGKKVYKRLGDVVPDTDGEIRFDNTNIHKHLTKGSAMIGGMKFEMVVTARGAKLEICLHGQMHVRQGTSSQEEEQDDEAIDAFSSIYSSKPKAKVTSEEELEGVDLGDLDDPQEVEDF